MQSGRQRNGAGKAAWALGLVLAAGAALRLAGLTADPFAYDAYALLSGIGGPFGEYVSGGGYSLPIRVSSWVAAQFFGADLGGLQVLPVLTGLAALCVVGFGAMGRWPASPALWVAAALGLALNGHAQYVAGFAAVTYGVSFLVGCWLPFFLLRVVEEERGPSVVFFVLCLLPVGFLSNLYVAAPVLSGAASAVLTAWVLPQGGDRRTAFRRALTAVLPLLVLPAVLVTVQIASPFDNLGFENRPDMRGYFLASSDFGTGATGAARFVVHNALMLIGKALWPAGAATGVLSSSPGVVKLAVCGVLAAMALVYALAAFKGRLDRRDVLLVVYFLSTMAGIALGGVLGLFPFGGVRYADFLVVPLLLLLVRAVMLIAEVLRGVAVARGLAVFGVALLTVLAVHVWRGGTAQAERNAETLAWAAQVPAESVLYTEYVRPVLRVRAPQLIDRGRSLGWGGGRAGAVEDALRGRPGPVLVVHAGAAFSSRFPAVETQFRNMGFVRAEDRSASGVGAILFSR